MGSVRADDFGFYGELKSFFYISLSLTHSHTHSAISRGDEGFCIASTAQKSMELFFFLFFKFC